jgi:LPXTG-motif cell wall-anchored protein
MRRLRLVLAGGLLGALLLLPAPASAGDKQVGLHGMTCTGITAMGEGLPKSTVLGLALVDPTKDETLAERTVRTSAQGDFETRLEVGLHQRLTVRLQVTGPGGSRIGSAEHAMEKGSPMCDLPFTGASSTAVLLTVGLSLLGLGVGLLVLTRRGRSPSVDA